MENSSYVDLRMISVILQRVLSQEISREEASNWAYKTRVGLEERRINFLPAKDERKIWDAIFLVEGIDLKDSPNSYLHCLSDVVEWNKKLELDVSNSAA
ncbi:hypothetical protein [Hymenobacter sp. PAMC 26628]|uniref:hypothetical protein n=1 Tax=Hymenobacter sp. PAMC 26628 TaxID=1484118 RepID=UPI0012FF63B8|nr:hypothetical protein [Hymenobacter sp. PAMC 26628]